MGLITPYSTLSEEAFQFWARPVIANSNGTLYTPGFEGPPFAINPWDYLDIPIDYSPALPGQDTRTRTPGLCRVRLRKERSVDKQKPVGGDGARVIFHGVDPAEFDIELRIWTPEQLRLLGRLWKEIFPPADKGFPKAYTVQHPLLALHDVKAIQFISGEGPDIQGDRTGVFRMRAIEFIKPVTTKSAVHHDEKPVGSKHDPPKKPKPSENRANLGPRP